MHAAVWPSCIDIFGAGALSEETWERLLDELKAEHVPSLTPAGKRMSVGQTANGQINVTVYRTAGMSSQEIIHVLRRHGIEAMIGSAKSASA